MTGRFHLAFRILGGVLLTAVVFHIGVLRPPTTPDPQYAVPIIPTPLPPIPPSLIRNAPDPDDRLDPSKAKDPPIPDILSIFAPPPRPTLSPTPGTPKPVVLEKVATTPGPPAPDEIGPKAHPLDLPVDRAERSMDEVERLVGANVTDGGYYAPRGIGAVTARSSLLIIPFRDRWSHFRLFLRHMHPFLQRQRIKYKILVVEQVDKRIFNRAKLFNVGAWLAPYLGTWDCLVFHDVDLLPLRDEIPYACHDIKATHLAVGMSKFKFRMPYDGFAGGAVSLTPDQMTRINGFSNEFWGWGGEDDEIAKRGYLAKVSWFRPPGDIARYQMIRHGLDKANPVNPKRMSLIKNAYKTWKTDGLSSLTFRLVSFQEHKLFTHVGVSFA